MHRPQFLPAFLIWPLFCIHAWAADAGSLPIAVSPSAPAIQYMGRWDAGDRSKPRASWSASTVALCFRGTDLNATFSDPGQNRWQVEIDGKAAEALQMEAGEHSYRVAAGLSPAVHTVRLVKATEAMVGPSQLLGFQLSESGALLPISAPKRRIEVIGDSISCGYGNEGANQNEHFSPKTENAYYTYGAIAARALDAGYACIAWSGRKMWPDFTMPEIYDLVIATEPEKKWDFAKQIPDAVVINLSTNDFGKQNPEEAGWTGAYEEFVKRVLKHYPKAIVFCASSPMMGDWNDRKSRTVADKYLHKIVDDLTRAGDSKVQFIEFAGQDGNKDGLGSDWHPNVKTQQKMAEKLEAALKASLHW